MKLKLSLLVEKKLEEDTQYKWILERLSITLLLSEKTCKRQV